MKSAEGILSRKIYIVLLYILLGLVASLQSYEFFSRSNSIEDSKTHESVESLQNKETQKSDSLYQKNDSLLHNTENKAYTRYNNFLIFKYAFKHLKAKKDLYIPYPDEYFDLYKYTPGFAYFFGFFNLFSNLSGLILWNLLNALILLFAIYKLPNFNQREKGLMLVLLSVELMTSLQNEQSNGLLAGLLVLSFSLMESNKLFWASLCLVSSVFIKLFGVLGFVLILFYPGKLKFIGYSLFWSIIWAAAPLIYLSITEYQELLQSYLHMLSNDHSESYGLSLMGILHSWFGLEGHKLVTVFAGLGIFLLPYLRLSQYKNFTYRELSLCALMIWILIFNHKAESPTFIIAMSGISIWYIRNKENKIVLSLFILAFILTCLSPTDLFPRYVLHNFIKPYQLKALPSVLIWIYITYTLLTTKDLKTP